MLGSTLCSIFHFYIPPTDFEIRLAFPTSIVKLKASILLKIFLFSGHEPIYFIENKEKSLRASYDRGTQIVDYMD
jgi:hypothetical protein